MTDSLACLSALENIVCVVCVLCCVGLFSPLLIPLSDQSDRQCCSCPVLPVVGHSLTPSHGLWTAPFPRTGSVQLGHGQIRSRIWKILPTPPPPTTTTTTCTAGLGSGYSLSHLSPFCLLVLACLGLGSSTPDGSALLYDHWSSNVL